MNSIKSLFNSTSHPRPIGEMSWVRCLSINSNMTNQGSPNLICNLVVDIFFKHVCIVVNYIFLNIILTNCFVIMFRCIRVWLYEDQNVFDQKLGIKNITI